MTCAAHFYQNTIRFQLNDHGSIHFIGLKGTAKPLDPEADNHMFSGTVKTLHGVQDGVSEAVYVFKEEVVFERHSLIIVTGPHPQGALVFKGRDEQGTEAKIEAVKEASSGNEGTNSVSSPNPPQTTGDLSLNDPSPEVRTDARPPRRTSAKQTSSSSQRDDIRRGSLDTDKNAYDSLGHEYDASTADWDEAHDYSSPSHPSSPPRYVGRDSPGPRPFRKPFPSDYGTRYSSPGPEGFSGPNQYDSGSSSHGSWSVFFAKGSAQQGRHLWRVDPRTNESAYWKGLFYRFWDPRKGAPPRLVALYRVYSSIASVQRYEDGFRQSPPPTEHTYFCGAARLCWVGDPVRGGATLSRCDMPSCTLCSILQDGFPPHVWRNGVLLHTTSSEAYPDAITESTSRLGAMLLVKTWLSRGERPSVSGRHSGDSVLPLYLYLYQ